MRGGGKALFLGGGHQDLETDQAIASACAHSGYAGRSCSWKPDRQQPAEIRPGYPAPISCARSRRVAKRSRRRGGSAGWRGRRLQKRIRTLEFLLLMTVPLLGCYLWFWGHEWVPRPPKPSGPLTMAEAREVNAAIPFVDVTIPTAAP